MGGLFWVRAAAPLTIAPIPGADQNQPPSGVLGHRNDYFFDGPRPPEIVGEVNNPVLEAVSQIYRGVGLGQRDNSLTSPYKDYPVPSGKIPFRGDSQDDIPDRYLLGLTGLSLRGRYAFRTAASSFTECHARLLVS
jgi:hypothetical protein